MKNREIHGKMTCILYALEVLCMEIKQLIAQAIKEAIDKAYPGVDTGLDYEALLEEGVFK